MPAWKDQRRRPFGPAAAAELPEPRSAGEVTAIAFTREAEAARRYRALYQRLPVESPESLSLLKNLAEQHESCVAALQNDLTRQDLDRQPADIPYALWTELYADEETALCDPHSVTPYRVLAFAVETTDRTFALYSYLAAAATDSEVRHIAEGYAEDALARSAAFRAARRRAYHETGDVSEGGEAPPAHLVKSLDDFLAAALVIETTLDRQLAKAGGLPKDLSSCRDLTRHQIEDLRRDARNAGPLSADLASALARPRSAATTVNPRQVRAACSRAFTFYDAVASRPANEEVMLKAQALSQAALRRLQGLDF